MGKSGIKGYDIEIFNLLNKQYDFDFEIDDVFFNSIEESLVQKGKAKVEIVLTKSETLIEMNLLIKGFVELVCDRSLDSYDFPLELEQGLIYKFGSEDMELDDFMFQIQKGTESINLAQIIYEIICLAIPMKKLHPRYQLEDDNEEEGTMIYSSGEDQENDADKDDEEIDPRWQKLNELRNNKQ